MTRVNTGDVYTAEGAYGETLKAQPVCDMNTRPGRGLVKIEDSTSGTDLTNVRALYFATAGTVTLTDYNDHTESDVPVVAGLVLSCEFTHIADVSCTVYAIS